MPKMKIDFFEAVVPAGQQSVDAILRAIHALEDDDDKAYTLTADSSAWLLQLHEYNSKIEGNFVRGRLDYLPKKAKPGGRTTGLNVRNNEAVTDESAFILDPTANVLALQRNRYGLSQKGVEHYLNGHQSLAEPIQLSPLVKSATLTRLARMSHTKKIVIKLARPQDQVRQQAGRGASTNEAIKVLNRLNSPTLQIQASVGRTDGTLSQVKEFARELLALNDQDYVDVNSLQITGEIDEVPTLIDLIEDRLIAVVSVEAGQRRTLPYPNRRVSLREAWSGQLSELRAYGVIS